MALAAAEHGLCVQGRRPRAGRESRVGKVDAGVDDCDRNARPGRRELGGADGVSPPGIGGRRGRRQEHRGDYGGEPHASEHTGRMPTAYIGLGSNLGDRETTIRAAIAALPGVVAVSELHETEPVGVVDQPQFLNGAARLETELSPRALLASLLAVERELGREPGERWGPRTIDLDLLLYGTETVDEPGLTVPHPHLHERRFALEPLAELDPELVVPGRGRVDELLAKLD